MHISLARSVFSSVCSFFPLVLAVAFACISPELRAVFAFLILILPLSLPGGFTPYFHLGAGFGAPARDQLTLQTVILSYLGRITSPRADSSHLDVVLELLVLSIHGV